jgi:hypothetical protein
MEAFEKEKLRFFRDTTLINSWHINNEESAAMWDLYSGKNAGVAIQSTYRRLSECFEGNQEDPIFIGMVSYIDFKSDNDLSGVVNLFDTVLLKRRSFSHESELRAISSLMNDTNLEMFLYQFMQLDPAPIREERNINPTQKTDNGKYVCGSGQID